MITFLCAKCGMQHSVPDEWADKTAKCPCGETNVIPSPAKLVQNAVQLEVAKDSEDPVDFVSAEEAFPAISSVPRLNTRKRTLWWLAISKYLSSAVVAALIVLGYWHYYLGQPLPFIVFPKTNDDELFSDYVLGEETTEEPLRLRDASTYTKKLDEIPGLESIESSLVYEELGAEETVEIQSLPSLKSTKSQAKATTHPVDLNDKSLKFMEGHVEEDTLRQLRELKSSADISPKKSHAAAEIWYNIAKKRSFPFKRYAEGRAISYYRRSLSTLEGPEKLQVLKKIEEYELRTNHSPPRTTTKRYNHGRIVSIDCSEGLSFMDAKKAQYDAAKAYGVPVEIQNKFGMRFRFIPAGEFLMGSPLREAHRRSNETQHVVKISKPFYIGTTEVTQVQYWNVTGQEPSRAKNKPNNPVEMVSWKHAKSFCKMLTERDSKGAYRLPTEAQWEYACRAGTLSATYGPLDKIAWTRNNSKDKTMPVGLLAGNAWGLFDCIGNANEWCRDLYYEDYYSHSLQYDPENREAGGERAHRGRSICQVDGPAHLRSASRGHFGSKEYNLGFRVILLVRNK